MNYWKREPFQAFIEKGHFSVEDAGPLHSPVNAFKIARDDKLDIIFETVGDDETENNFVLKRAGYSAGTARQNTDRVTLKSLMGTTATAGRKAGSITRRTREIAEGVAEDGETPLEYMLKVMRDETESKERRDEMAKAAAPYCHARLQPVPPVKKESEDPLKLLLLQISGTSRGLPNDPPGPLKQIEYVDGKYKEVDDHDA